MSQPSRMLPPNEIDIQWWWDEVQKDVLPIQRCGQCQTLRHPPRPMCSECRSMEFDFIESTGKGVLASHTALYHPQFPGYEYPIAMGLIDLEEGTRITAEIKGISVEDIQFGMSVEVQFQQDPSGFKLPVFVAVEGEQA